MSPMIPEKSAKGSRAAALTEDLRSAILRGVLAPNARLRLEELGASYGVSFSPVREALLRLCGEGFVVSEEQRGFRVAETSLQKLEEVIALRSVLEPLALRLSIERGDPKWEEHVVAISHRLKRVEETPGRAPYDEEWESVHRQFHQALIGGCDMPMLMHFSNVLHDQTDRYRRLYLKDRIPKRNVAREHSEILAAVLARDVDRACAALLKHTKQTGAAIQDLMIRSEKLKRQ
ncbi:MAG: hypothetical protein JWP65_313 [Ramlibacter sp.]|nr:hypothetical protein [Ramlibacter sp.]